MIHTRPQHINVEVLKEKKPCEKINKISFSSEWELKANQKKYNENKKQTHEFVNLQSEKNLFCSFISSKASRETNKTKKFLNISVSRNY